MNEDEDKSNDIVDLLLWWVGATFLIACLAFLAGVIAALFSYA